MSTIVGEQIPAPSNPQQNVSYSFIQTAWLEVINRYGGVGPDHARNAVDAAFIAAVRQLDKLNDVPYPPLPPVLQRHVDGVWELQLAFLQAMQEAGRIRCL